MGRFSWLGGKSTPRDDAKSIERARRHRKQATKTDRRGWRDHEQRDRRLYGE